MWEDMIRFLLTPYAGLAELFFNHRFEYVNGLGYIEQTGSYMIGADCLGLRFMAAFFMLCTIPFLRYFTGWQKLKWGLFSLAGSLVVGFFVNVLRILGSIPFTGSEKFNMIHASIGITLYFLTFILGYYLLKRYCQGKEKSNENEENI